MSFGPQGPAIESGPSNAETLQGWLPASPVIKAFNTLFASNQADPIREGEALDGYVAGDDAAAKALVLELVGSIGLQPVDVGPLARAQQLEQLAFLNIALNLAPGSSWTSGWQPGRSADRRDEGRLTGGDRRRRRPRTPTGEPG